MRVAVIAGGQVVGIVMLDDTMVIDTDRKAARGPASYTMGDSTVDYEAVYSAPDGSVLVASTTAGVGWSWTANGGFVEPPPVTPPPQTVFAPRDFIKLFTSAEQDELFGSTATPIRKFIAIALAGPVDLTLQEVIDDVNAVRDAGLLTSDRAAQILAGTPAPV